MAEPDVFQFLLPKQELLRLLGTFSIWVAVSLFLVPTRLSRREFAVDPIFVDPTSFRLRPFLYHYVSWKQYPLLILWCFLRYDRSFEETFACRANTTCEPSPKLLPNLRWGTELLVLLSDPTSVHQ